MTNKELQKILKKLPEGQIVITIEDGILYPIKQIKVLDKTIVIECREINLSKEAVWLKV